MNPDSSPISIRRGPRFDRDMVETLSRSFEGSSPTEVIGWAVDTYSPRLSLAASFADTLLIDFAVAVDPDIEIIFVDTGLHFPETLATVRRALVRYSLNLTVLRPDHSSADVWEHGIETCCGIRKVVPLEGHLTSRSEAWLSGLRRDDSTDRARTPIISLDRRGLVKINPLAAWSASQLDTHVLEHDVLVNPLVFEGYPSIGCWPCTEPATGDDQRAGRWAGSAKSECGLHK